VAAPLLTGVQNNGPFFEIHISPREPVDLPAPAHGLFDGPQIILRVWIRLVDNPKDIFLGWNVFDPLFGILASADLITCSFSCVMPQTSNIPDHEFATRKRATNQKVFLILRSFSDLFIRIVWAFRGRF
jgi:hypothetical protein